MTDSPTILEQGLATLQTSWIPIILVPFAYIVLSQVSKSVGTPYFCVPQYIWGRSSVFEPGAFSRSNQYLKSLLALGLGGQSNKGKAAGSNAPDHSNFDLSNIRVAKILIHPIKVCDIADLSLLAVFDFVEL